MKDIHDQTYYELLEIDPSASQEEILKAYNRARATYGNNSPALYSLFNKDEAQELLKLIDEAYSVLSNQFKRKQYDAKTTGRPSLKDPPSLPKVEGEEAYIIPGSNSPGHRKSPPSPKYNRGIPTQSASQAVAQTAKPVPKPLPPQKAKNPNLTLFGEYTPDPTFEDEIKTTEDFTGPVLQKIRLYKKIGLDQISDAIKVSRPYLSAIESNNFTSLPAPVFVRGFLVQIAKILNLDQNKVANSYLKLLRETLKK